MQYRVIHEYEAREFINIVATAFYYNPEPELSDLEAGRLRYDYIRAAFTESGEMAAAMMLYPFDAFLDGHVVGMGGIGNVACLPQFRRQGLIRGLFGDAFSHMRSEGYALSYLYPFSHPYYRKFNYELCCSFTKITADPEDLVAFCQPGHTERFQTGDEGTDPEDIINIYNQFASRNNLMLDRDGWWWELKLEKDPLKARQHIYIWYDEEHHPKAYVIYNYDLKEHTATLNVTDIAWTDYKGMYSILGFLGKLGGNVESITMSVPSEMVYEYFWREPYNVTASRQPGGMCRIIDAGQVLEVIEKPEKAGSVVLKLHDEMIAENNGTFEIAWGRDGTNVTRTSAECDLECSIEALAQMATGYVPFKFAASRRDVVVSAKFKQLEALFPKKNVFISDYF